jgi:hypothetical protein
VDLTGLEPLDPSSGVTTTGAHITTSDAARKRGDSQRSARQRRSVRRPVRARRDRRGEPDASADRRSEDRAPAAASSRSDGRTPTALLAGPCRVMLPRRCHHQDRLSRRCRIRTRDLTQIMATEWQHQQQLTIGRAVPPRRSPNSATTQRLRGLRRPPSPGARQLPPPLQLRVTRDLMIFRND